MKNSKMILKPTALLILGCLLTMSCQDHLTDLEKKAETTKTTSSDYLIFGHVNGFCINCDVLYKIENGSVNSTKPSTNLDPNTATFSFLKTLDANSSTADLTRNIPSELLNEQATDIGTPRPDFGHYYIEVKNAGTVKHWYVEAAGVPTYLTKYLADIETEMNKLR